jgi:hypothetical protein
MVGIGDLYVKQNKPEPDGHIWHVFPHMQNLDLKKDLKVEEEQVEEEVWASGRTKREKTG